MVMLTLSSQQTGAGLLWGTADLVEADPSHRAHLEPRVTFLTINFELSKPVLHIRRTRCADIHAEHMWTISPVAE